MQCTPSVLPRGAVSACQMWCRMLASRAKKTQSCSTRGQQPATYRYSAPINRPETLFALRTKRHTVDAHPPLPPDSPGTTRDKATRPVLGIYFCSSFAAKMTLRSLVIGRCASSRARKAPRPRRETHCELRDPGRYLARGPGQTSVR